MPKRKTLEEFKKEISNKYSDEYKVLSKEYINNKTKVIIKHNVCGHNYEVTPHDILQGYRCPKCFGTPKKSLEQFKKEINLLYNNEYIVIDNKYINTNTKILMKHNICGNEFYIRPNDILRGYKCPICGGCKKKTLEQFKEEVNKISHNEYSVIDDKYINNKTLILMKHNICGNEFYMRPNDFQQGYRCPKCIPISKGESRIKSFLEENKIIYKTQVSFPDCKYKNLLKFDFQLLLDNNNIILIEYDGEQHFKIKYYDCDLDLQKKRDKIKDNYCKEQGIHLYRIKYTEYNNIEKILKEIIEKESSTTIESIE